MSLYKQGLALAVRGAALEKQAYMVGAQHILVGTTLFHGISDRDTAAEQIDTAIQAIASAVVRAAGGDPSLLTSGHNAFMRRSDDPNFFAEIAESRATMEKSPYISLWDDAVSPTLNEWNSFYANRQHWYDLFTEVFTSWEDYKRWFDRVEDLRKRVEKAGISVSLPAMRPLSKSVSERTEEATADVWNAMKSLGSLIKNVVYAAIIIVGGMLVYKFYLAHQGHPA